MPLFAPTNSPTIAPITESAEDVFKAGKRKGRAFGNLSFVNICQRVADRDLNKSNDSLSIDLSPLVPLTIVGKNDTNAAAAILEPTSVPNHKTRSGAIAIIGVVCSAITNG